MAQSASTTAGQRMMLMGTILVTTWGKRCVGLDGLGLTVAQVCIVKLQHKIQICTVLMEN